MENARIANHLYDAVDLLKMVEHIVDGQASDAGSRRSDVPWSGIRLTLSQTRDLILTAVEGVSVESDEGDVPLAPRTRRRDRNRDSESITNPSVEYSGNEGNRSSLVRELVDNGSTGTFNRLQLPRESSASGEVL